MRSWVGPLRAAAALGPCSESGGFRTRFDFGSRDASSWFPGHMAKGLRQMRASLRRADCLVEVHDARISLDAEFCAVPYCQVLPVPKPLERHRPPARHSDCLPAPCFLQHALSPCRTALQRVLEQLRQQGCSHVVFTDCQRDSNVKKIVPLVAKLVSSSPRYHRAESIEYNIMVIGVPNVGKSSLINSLRRLHLKKGRATAVGGEPGVTKAVLTRIQVCETPLMYLVDTPGVLPPKLADVETGMKLALCGAIRDHLVGEDIMADYLLYVLNQQQQFGYMERYGLPEASDNIRHVLKYVAVTLGKTQKVKVLTGTGNVNIMMLNYSAAAYEFLRAFRAGRLGRLTLD
ncbi:mitochondrial ribosome-associated GTPase 1 isoform X3 [Centrocercus urophasianus]|uniref:mitochondrial ribosome-associated GTPase 1 isoform X3 n=1 Tax=Centrocercus urophasianus TaxID=9002 RepID=UPI001C65036D|nr:mitochondrial ribosome-associated GTPase 1 isoform X3 [Centrocercus urophasianus]